MSVNSIIENLNLRLSGKFGKAVTPYVSGYLLFYVLLFFIIIPIVEAIGNIMSGFSLYVYLPDWMRFIILDLISSALLSFPFGIVAGFFISLSTGDLNGEYREILREKLSVECIECSNAIKPQGEWFSGDIDIRCGVCEALMTLTIEDSNFKRLALKQPSKFSQDEIKTRKKWKY